MFIVNTIKSGETLRKNGQTEISVKSSEEISHLRRKWAWTVDAKNKDKKTVVFISIRKNWELLNISGDGTFDLAVTGISWQRSPLTWSCMININRWGKEQPCYWMLQAGGGRTTAGGRAWRKRGEVRIGCSIWSKRRNVEAFPEAPEEEESKCAEKSKRAWVGERPQRAKRLPPRTIQSRPPKSCEKIWRRPNQFEANYKRILQILSILLFCKNMCTPVFACFGDKSPVSPMNSDEI